MRFVCGPIPLSREFDPQTRNWTPLGESAPGRLALIAVLLGLPCVIAGVILLLGMKSEIRALFHARPLIGGAYFLVCIGMLPIHELIHALAYGRGVRSPHLIVGLWPSRGLCYAIYDSPLPRTRVLAMLVAPVMTLSVFPLLFLPWLSETWRGLVLAYSLLHAGACGGDLIGLTHLISQVPRRALIHNHGWQTYWNVPVNESSHEAQGG